MTKTTIKKITEISKNFVLPSLVLGSFLFYLFWSLPLQILLQSYKINSLFIKSHKLIIYSIIICLLIIFILALLSYMNKKKWNSVIIGVIIVLGMMTIFYQYVFPYNYGRVVDDLSLTPTKSLLGFGNLYYLLDLIILTSTVLIVRIIITSNKVTQVSLLLLLFFSIENISTLYKGIQNKKYSTQSTDLTKEFNPVRISDKHENVLLLIYDGLSYDVMTYFLTNKSVEEKYTDWTNDFISYPNTTCLKGLTLASLPTIYGGYDFSLEKQVDDLLFSKKFSEKQISYMFYSDLAKEDLAKNLSSYAYFEDMSGPLVNINLSDIPIITASLYKTIPYFLRHLLATDYQWKIKNRTLWLGTMGSVKRTTILSDKTRDKGVLMTYYSEYSHVPWSSTNGKLSFSDAKSAEDIEMILYHNTRDIFIEISSFINQLKNQNIYHNTKIIITADHGTHSYLRTKIVSPFLSKLEGNKGSGPVLMMKMIGNSKMKNPVIKTDDRFLSLGDIRGIIENTFGKKNLPDYSKVLPPLRSFNNIDIPTRALEAMVSTSPSIEATKALRKLEEENKFSYIKVFSKNPYRATTNITFYNLSNIRELAPYEIIE
ncbi:MAG: hypothetical protein ACRCVW_06585 [Brevinema sp.]